MPAQLLALTDGPSLILDKPILLIGRHGECDIQLNSRKVSRRHCCIAQVSDYLVVRDLGSTNGIRINGERVLEGRLRGGDELTVGNFRYQVFLEGRSSSGHPQVPPRSGRNDEARLEEADEPVPLDESGTGKVLPAHRPPPPKTHDDSLVLPDKLRHPDPPKTPEGSGR
ncbi:MAG TPA: FHA domain-containing protein [Gemmataceae bacterium]|nr:FHA domain-containing protein [Gemmataceae bacterium]